MEGAAKVERDELGRIKPGSVANPAGRKPGALNALTVEIKGAIEGALAFAGRRLKEKEENKHLRELPDGMAWLAHQAEVNPQLFAAILAKIIPANLKVDVTVLGRDLLDLLQERRDKLASMKDVTPVEGKKRDRK